MHGRDTVATPLVTTRVLSPHPHSSPLIPLTIPPLQQLFRYSPSTPTHLLATPCGSCFRRYLVQYRRQPSLYDRGSALPRRVSARLVASWRTSVGLDCRPLSPTCLQICRWCVRTRFQTIGSDQLTGRCPLGGDQAIRQRMTARLVLTASCPRSTADSSASATSSMDNAVVQPASAVRTV